MEDFSRYRTFRGLPPTPSALDMTPVILSNAGRVEDCFTPTALYLIVKDVLPKRQRLSPRVPLSRPPCCGPPLTGCATPRPRTKPIAVQTCETSKGRHASIETTAVYLHTTDDARHRDTTRKA